MSSAGLSSAGVRAGPSRLVYIDALRVYGAIAVVCIHAMGVAPTAPGVTLWQVQLASAASNIMRWCVPIFIMISGALLLDPSKDEPVVVFLRKRLWRVGLPLMFWTLFYAVWSHEALGPLVRDLLIGRPYYHLYFLVILLGLYAVTPFLRVFTRHATRSQLLWASVLSMAMASMSLLIQWMRWGPSPNFISRFVPYVGYFLVGYYLRDVALSARAARWWWVVLAVCLASIAAPDCIALAQHGPATQAAVGDEVTVNTASAALGKLISYCHEFLNPPIMLASVGVFLLAARLHREHGRLSWLNPVMAWLGPPTLGVYLVHPAVLDVLIKVGPDRVWANLWMGLIVTPAVTFGVSLLITLVIQRVPLLRRVVG